MRKNTSKNREKLAREVVNQTDLDDLIEARVEELEDSYEDLSDEEFHELWLNVFGISDEWEG
jgi:hypothetical protein